MTSFRKGVSISLAIVIAASSVPLLAGCTGAQAQGAVNGAVQGASGGDVSLGGKLPTGWPAEVPVIEGNLLLGAGKTSNGRHGWVATIKSAASDPLADARTKLEGAGFVVDTSAAVPGGDGGAVAMKNDAYTVVVAGSAAGLLYTVMPAR